jgi:hypothetical protein
MGKALTWALAAPACLRAKPPDEATASVAAALAEIRPRPLGVALTQHLVG